MDDLSSSPESSPGPSTPTRPLPVFEYTKPDAMPSTSYTLSMPEDPLIIPTTPLTPFTLKRGRLLCTRRETWCGKKYGLRWREFKAELLHDRLELYLITSVAMRRRHRLAHVIYLRNLKLSLASAGDSVWRVAYTTKSRHISYLFQARTPTDACEWYMTFYRLLAVKDLPVPTSLDLHVPTLDVRVRLPLVHLDKHHNIRAEHVKNCVLSMLNARWSANDFQLCWRRNEHILWLTDYDFVIGPQAIQRTHELELRSLTEHRLSPLQKQPPACEGFVMIRWDTHQKWRRLYASTEGNFLFLVDPSKAVPVVSRGPHTHRWTMNWISAATLPSRKARSVGGGEDSDEKERCRRARHVVQATMMIDLRLISAIQPGRHCSFEMRIRSQSIHVEVSSRTTMSDWVMRLRQLVHFSKVSQTTFKIETALWERAVVLLSGLLYVKRKRRGTFQQRLCVLTRGGFLVMFRRVKRKMWTSEARGLIGYPRDTAVVGTAEAYVYSGMECVQDDLELAARPPRIFEDGTSTSGDTAHACAFVVWRAQQRHVVASLRERLAWLKRGHRLGRKGTAFVFLAQSELERQTWVRALQHTQGLVVRIEKKID